MSNLIQEGQLLKEIIIICYFCKSKKLYLCVTARGQLSPSGFDHVSEGFVGQQRPQHSRPRHRRTCSSTEQLRPPDVAKAGREEEVDANLEIHGRRKTHVCPQGTFRSSQRRVSRTCERFEFFPIIFRPIFLCLIFTVIFFLKVVA